MSDKLLDAGWVKVGPYWKAPDDLGPSGRKWTVDVATAEADRRLSAPPKPKPKPKKGSTSKQSG